MKKMAFLGLPYTPKDAELTAEQKTALIAARVEAMCIVDALLMRRGLFTVSPIYKHFMLQYGDLPGDYTYWGEYSRELLERCDAYYLIMLEGWEESIGVQDELAYARELGMQIVYLTQEGKIHKTEN